MSREITQQPTDATFERTFNVMNLINSDCYYGLRAGEVIATSEGFAVKYGDNGDGQLFVGYLGFAKSLRNFLVLSPEIMGGVLNLDASEIKRYDRITRDQANKLIQILGIAGIRR